MTDYVPTPDTPASIWFNPLSYLADQIGIDDPIYQWWFNVLGEQCGSYVVDTAAFCAAGQPSFEEPTAATIAGVGPLQVLKDNMSDVLFQNICQPA